MSDWGQDEHAKIRMVYHAGCTVAREIGAVEYNSQLRVVAHLFGAYGSTCLSVYPPRIKQVFTGMQEALKRCGFTDYECRRCFSIMSAWGATWDQHAPVDNVVGSD